MTEALAKATVTDIQPIQELRGWAELGIKAQIIPSSMNAYQAMAIVQAGKEMGLQPLQSLRSMSFIKGRLTMSVQLQLAMAKNRGVKMDDPEEGDGYCIATLHRGTETQTCKYTIADAVKAQLVHPGGNYDKYQKQMLRWRAIGDALRLIAPDLVMNLLSPEEAASIEPLAPLPVESLKELAPPSAPRAEATADPVVNPPPTVETPPPPATPERDLHALINELYKLAQAARDKGLFASDGDAIFEWTKYTSKKTGKVMGFKDVTQLKFPWQAEGAIEKAYMALGSKPSSLDEERDDDIPL